MPNTRRWLVLLVVVLLAACAKGHKSGDRPTPSPTIFATADSTADAVAPYYASPPSTRATLLPRSDTVEATAPSNPAAPEVATPQPVDVMSSPVNLPYPDASSALERAGR